jgi:hypothetical protein
MSTKIRGFGLSPVSPSKILKICLYSNRLARENKDGCRYSNVSFWSHWTITMLWGMGGDYLVGNPRMVASKKTRP